jgi:aryl-alcohol dehydrogenase-like predicted oxidoreductase
VSSYGARLGLKGERVQYRRLGKTALEVSVVGVGTWQFGGEWGVDFTEATAAEVIDAAREVGINLIDTAECYGDHLSESLVGASIRKDRERWVVATKFGHRFAGHLKRDQLWSASQVRRQLEDSLRALGTDYIDVYQFHSGSNEVFENPELWNMLSRQVEQGKVRHLGISISNSDETTFSHQAGRAAEVGASVLQVYYNRLERRPEEHIFPHCRANDLGVLARVPLASGFLSGKYSPGATFDQGDVRAGRDREKVKRTLEEVARIRSTEVPEGVPMAAWALAWCLRDPVVSSVIPGCKSAEQVRQNAAAAEVRIEE